MVRLQDRIRPSLDPDVLTLIFSLIGKVGSVEDNTRTSDLNCGDSFEYRALYILRRSSQVCRLWRDVILGNPILWANNLEVELLACHKDGHWRREVLRRTGTELLSVKGHISKRGDIISLDWLLQTHWSRLRKLDIHANSRSLSWVKTSTWDVLRHPTNHLEFFNFSFLPETRAITFSSSVSQGRHRFSDHASALREFRSSHITFNLRAPWLPQITHITFSTPTLTIPQILSALERMPLVEVFDLRSTVEPFRSSLSSLALKVKLPRLRYITICHKLITSLATLGQITPAPGCCLRLRTTDTERNRMTVPTMNLIHSVVSCYFRNYFYPVQHNLPRLSIDLTQYNFRLVCSLSAPTSQGFDIDIFHGGGLPPAWTSVFLSVIFGCDLERIVLELCGMTGLSPFDPALATFLLKFTLVEELRVFSPDILELILQGSWDYEKLIFLPSLETIHFVGWKRVECEPTLSFLKWRQKLGVPIQVLHISQNSTRVRGKLSAFAQIDRLKII